VTTLKRKVYNLKALFASKKKSRQKDKVFAKKMAGELGEKTSKSGEALDGYVSGK